MQDSDETNALPQSPELLKPKPKVEQSSEKGRVMVTEAMRDIKETEQFVGHTTSASGAELTTALLTSRGMGTAVELGLEMVRRLLDDEAAAKVRAEIGRAHV